MGTKYTPYIAQSHGGSTRTIRDSEGNIVALNVKAPRADIIVHRVNIHNELVEALKTFISVIHAAKFGDPEKYEDLLKRVRGLK